MLTTTARHASVIVNALNPVYTQWDKLALPLADAALDVARATGALLMLPGNVYNFGSRLPARLTPATCEDGDVPKARIRIEMEARMAAAASQSVDSVVIRAGDFFGGPGKGSWFDMALASKVAKGKFIYPGNLDIAHAWAYLPDLAQAFVKVAARRSALHGHHRLHFAGHTLTGREFQAAIEARVGRSLKHGDLPWPVIRLAAPFVPMWRELLTMRYLWVRPHSLDDAEMRALIGEAPHTPLPQALGRALADLAEPIPAAPLARA